MVKFYKKRAVLNKRKIIRFCGVCIFLIGLITSIIIFFPIITGLVFANSNQEIAVPIPTRFVVTSATVQSIISQSVDNITGFDSTNAKEWFNNAPDGKPTAAVTSYNLSIPRLGISDAEVTTVDNALEKHLVNYQGTAIPPNKGTAVVFGHSTLPWLFDPKNYRAIFATLNTLKVGDIITVKVNGIVYTYKIYEMTVVDADYTEVFNQNYNDSYLILVTCSPPGTTWRRLLVKSRMEKSETLFSR